jgi:hypothetical protein
VGVIVGFVLTMFDEWSYPHLSESLS